MNLLPQYKIGDCECGCGGKQVEGRKVGKKFYCLYSYQTMKQKEQVSKANERNRVRSLGFKQRVEGKEDAASRQALIQDIDWVFSRIVRIQAADNYGNVQCYTCSTKKHWSMMQCGHYIGRANMGLRWESDNTRPQCKTCNEIKRGNLEAFSFKLEAEAPGLPESLYNRSKIAHSYGISELKELLFDFRAKLKPLEAKFSKPKNHIADTGKIGVNKIK